MMKFDSVYIREKKKEKKKRHSYFMQNNRIFYIEIRSSTFIQNN